MTKDEWDNCNDAVAMIAYLWTQEPLLSIAKAFPGCCEETTYTGYEEAELPLYKYYLASCREIFILLPQEESRKGIELSEKYIRGEIPWDELDRYNYFVEGAAFALDYNSCPDDIQNWVNELESNHQNILERYGMPDTRELLRDAAYFADYASIYSALERRGVPFQSYQKFLSAKLLREYVEYV